MSKTVDFARCPSNAGNLSVTVGDITACTSDVLVNSVAKCDKNLSNCGVIAQAFLAKVGQPLQDEFEKSGGLAEGKVLSSNTCSNLQCKMIIHIGIGSWNGDSTKQVLTQTLKACLSMVQTNKHVTVTFPAMGVGNLRYPTADLAQCFLVAAKDFPFIKIEVISFKQDQIFSSLQSAFAKVEKKGNIHIAVGDITKYKCDVLVNSVYGSDTRLSQCGAVAAAYSTTCGKVLDEDFASGGGLAAGAVRVSGTTAGLQCRMLLHLGIAAYKADDQTAQMITKSILDCIQQAITKGYKTIAFPTLGCGNLNTPAKVLGQCFVDAAKQHPSIAIHIICLKQDSVFDDMTKTITKGNVSTPSGKISVSIGDITKMKADVLVNSVAKPDKSLSSCGAIANAFLKAMGQPLQDDYNQRGGLSEGQVAESGVLNNLQAKMLLHVGICKWDSGGGQAKKALTEGITLCLKEAVKKSHNTICFPSMGCGNYNTPPKELADCFLRASNKVPNIKINIVCINNDNTYLEIKQILDSQPNTADQPSLPAAELVIRSRLKKLSDQKVKTPSAWTKYPRMSGVDARQLLHEKEDRNAADFLVDVSAGTAEFKAVDGLLQHSWDGTNILVVKSVQRVEQPIAYCDYMNSVKSIMEKGSTGGIAPITAIGHDTVHTSLYGDKSLAKMTIEGINEYLFFHGTKKTYHDAIVSQGLDFRMAANGNFGKGVYFAERVAKSMGYSDGTMFIVRATLGNIYYSKSTCSFLRPPCMVTDCEKPSGCSHAKFYDSVMGKGGYREFILYNQGYCYPLYLVQYELKSPPSEEEQ